jgi:putative SOS response-associated peptidase YedK
MDGPRRLRRSKCFVRRSSATAACYQPIMNGRIRQAAKSLGYFTVRNGSPALTVVGLWNEWRDKATGETSKSCTMIITEPSKFAAEVHDRMPVLLEEKD